MAGMIAKRGVPVLDVTRYVAIVSAGVVLLLIGLGVETRKRELAD